jgi:two-component system LytT family response regulator
VQQQINTNELLNRNKIIVENYNQPSYDQQKIILPTLEGFEVAKVSNISRLKGNGNFTDIYFNDGSKKMICRFLKHFDELLSIPFIRVHKSHIININYVKSYNKGGYIILLDSSEIELSATYKAHFLEAFGKS